MRKLNSTYTLYWLICSSSSIVRIHPRRCWRIQVSHWEWLNRDMYNLIWLSGYRIICLCDKYLYVCRMFVYVYMYVCVYVHMYMYALKLFTSILNICFWFHLTLHEIAAAAVAAATKTNTLTNTQTDTYYTTLILWNFRVCYKFNVCD